MKRIYLLTMVLCFITLNLKAQERNKHHDDDDDETCPVKLTSFNYEKSSCSFKWSTSTEMDNRCFVLQSSNDTKIWTEEAVIPSKSINGNSNYNIFYSYKIIPSKNYWRLFQYDYSGTYDSSYIVYINLVTIFPKIINNYITFTENSLIMDNSGQLIYEGSGTYELKSGIYYVFTNKEWFKILIE